VPEIRDIGANYSRILVEKGGATDHRAKELAASVKPPSRISTIFWSSASLSKESIQGQCDSLHCDDKKALRRVAAGSRVVEQLSLTVLEAASHEERKFHQSGTHHAERSGLRHVGTVGVSVLPRTNPENGGGPRTSNVI
jgi:hypothetical protein